MHILVIGAGLEGVTTAWYLRQRGHTVSVVERREGPALETSFANGGQISISHPEPWANPGAPAQILRWLGREDAPLLFRLPAEWARWRWGLAFLRECTPGRTHLNTSAIAQLAVHSLHCLKQVRSAAGIHYAEAARGVLHLFFTRGEARRIPRRVDTLARYGLRARALSVDEALALEPGLVRSARRLCGAMLGEDDESGDAQSFTAALAQVLAAQGVRFHFSTEVMGLERLGGRISGCHVRDTEGRDGSISADATVIAAGPWSGALVRPLGLKLPIYPVKGYSVTLPVKNPRLAPHTSLTDEARRVVCARLGEYLRIAGTAELNGFDEAPNPARSGALLRWAEEMLPGAADTTRAQCWNGLRPATPGNVPVIGASRLPGLWFNTGHGSLGWTLACGSADILADLIDGRSPAVPAAPFQRQAQ